MELETECTGEPVWLEPRSIYAPRCFYLQITKGRTFIQRAIWVPKGFNPLSQLEDFMAPATESSRMKAMG